MVAGDGFSFALAGGSVYGCGIFKDDQGGINGFLGSVPGLQVRDEDLILTCQKFGNGKKHNCSRVIDHGTLAILIDIVQLFFASLENFRGGLPP